MKYSIRLTALTLLAAIALFTVFTSTAAADTEDATEDEPAVEDAEDEPAVEDAEDEPAVEDETEEAAADESPAEAEAEEDVDEPEPEPEERLEVDVDEAPEAAEDVADVDRRRPETERHLLTLLLTGNLDGHFAHVDCRKDEGYEELFWAKHVAYHDALQGVAEDADMASPLALNVGNSIFPGALGRYLTFGQPRGDYLAELMAMIPLANHGVGPRELSVPRPALVDFTEALGDEHGVDVQAANLHCVPGSSTEAICRSVASSGDDEPYRIVERGELRIAVTTVLAEEIAGLLAGSQMDGFEIGDPAERLSGLVDQMRDEADLVIVQHQVPSGQAAPLAYDLASAVEGIDLLVTSHLLREPRNGGDFDPGRPVSGGRTAVIEAASTGTPIISANRSINSAVNVELDVVGRSDEDDEHRWRIRAVTPHRVLIDDMPRDPEAERKLSTHVEAFCADWGDPISEHANLEAPFEMEDMHQFVLNVMRFSTDSEVALSNRRAFRNEEQFPLTDDLTRADVYATLPYDNRLVIADIEGFVLEGLADRLADDVVGAGIDVSNGEVTVNGRSVNSDRVYRVALNDYLSAGGDGVFVEGDVDNLRYYHPHWSDDPPSIGDIVIDVVQRGEHLLRGQVRDAVSAEANFPDLHRKFLWTLTGSVNSSYNQVAVENPRVDDEPAYDQSQLTVQSTDQINLEGRFAANADSRNHGWNNDLNIQYATARISDEDAVFETTKDQIRFRSRYRYKRLRADLEGLWYVPDPVVEGQVETEFSSPEDRDWHRVDLRAIAGASFQLLDPLDVRLGANVRHDINEPDATPTWGVNASYTLARITPFRIQDRPIRFESEVEYFFNDIGNDNIHEVRTQNRLFFAMFNQFFFTTSFNAFLYRDDVVGELGSNTELTIGVNYEWEGWRQNF